MKMSGTGSWSRCRQLVKKLQIIFFLLLKKVLNFVYYTVLIIHLKESDISVIMMTLISSLLTIDTKLNRQLKGTGQSIVTKTRSSNKSFYLTKLV